jgi:hypothetical protein
MNLGGMRLGTENKKAVYALAILGVVLLGSLYYNSSDTPSSSGTAAPAAAVPPPPMAGTPDTDSNVPARVPGRANANAEFRPVLHSKHKEDQIDPMSVDPSLRLDLLAKIQDEKPPAAERNLFQIGTEPPKPEDKLKGPEPKILVAKTMGPTPLPEPAKPAPPPPPPPINVKYYGFASPTTSGHKRGFFMDGDDILIKAEGDTLKGHYRVVRLNATSVVVEDTDSKRQQTLPMTEDAQG